HTARGVERLGHADERRPYPVQRVNDASEVSQASGQPVDLVNDDDVDLPASDIIQQLLQARASHVPARPATVVILFVDQLPAFVRLAEDVRSTRFSLGIKAVECLLEPFLCRLASVDGTAALHWDKARRR